MNRKHLYWIIPSALTTILVALYFLIPVFAKAHIQRKIKQFETERTAEVTLNGLHIGLLHFNGEIPISLQSVTLHRKNADDTLLYLTNLKANVRVLKGFHQVEEITAFSSDSIVLHLIHKDGYKNYDFLMDNGVPDKDKSTVKTNYKELSERCLQKIEGILPETMNIKTLAIAADLQERHFDYTMPGVAIGNGILQGSLVERTESASHTWSINGTFDHTSHSYCATLTDSNGNAGFAILNELTHAQFGFRKIRGELSLAGTTAEASHYYLMAEADGLLLDHHYLATHPVAVNSASAQLRLTFSPTRLSIDSSSILRLNKAELHPFLSYEKDHGEKPRISLIIDERDQDANQLFGSLPDGLFQVIPNLQLSGRMDFSLHFDCDFSEVDSLRLDFFLGSRDHSIRINGDKDRITRFNTPFEYVFFENGDTARIVTIGPANPHFCPFDQIPPYLTKSILATEDAGFFQHRGFIKSSIREALATDIKAGKLRRGGSTLTMQLVKNLFLNRNKVFSRKFEEMILVWLIEDYHLISKERMFEIYVNIAEWGPGIIGIGEAADFYFGKKPQELTLGECLYLASLIRSPKHYRSTLDDYGNVIDSKREELIFVARRMVERAFITEDEFNHFNSFIHTKCMDIKDE